MNDAKGVLQYLGYDEIRDRDGGEWKPLEAVNGQLGTTDDTHLIRPQNNPHLCRLVDPESGERIGTARKAETE